MSKVVCRQAAVHHKLPWVDKEGYFGLYQNVGDADENEDFVRARAGSTAMQSLSLYICYSLLVLHILASDRHTFAT